LTNRGDGNAVITVGTSHLTKYYGEYIGTSGHLSSNDVLQDSHYWQLYSYVIRSSQSLRRWGDVVKKLLHPAGSVVFSESSLFTSEATDQVQNIKWVLINIFNSVVATVQARTLHSMKIRTRQPGTGGFTFYELDKYKFKYNRDLNYQTAVAADSVKTGVSFDWNYSGTINNGYWTGYWETPISHYKDVKINTPSNVVLIQQRDPYIKIYQST
jgi:hypothetical protein